MLIPWKIPFSLRLPLWKAAKKIAATHEGKQFTITGTGKQGLNLGIYVQPIAPTTADDLALDTHTGFWLGYFESLTGIPYALAADGETVVELDVSPMKTTKSLVPLVNKHASLLAKFQQKDVTYEGKTVRVEGLAQGAIFFTPATKSAGWSRAQWTAWFAAWLESINYLQPIVDHAEESGYVITKLGPVPVVDTAEIEALVGPPITTTLKIPGEIATIEHKTLDAEVEIVGLVKMPPHAEFGMGPASSDAPKTVMLPTMHLPHVPEMAPVQVGSSLMVICPHCGGGARALISADLVPPPDLPDEDDDDPETCGVCGSDTAHVCPSPPDPVVTFRVQCETCETVLWLRTGPVEGIL